MKASSHSLSVSQVFVFAGLLNIIGLLVFSLGFTNDSLMQVNPILVSPFGILVVMVWGLAYISVAERYDQVPQLVAVFALEKFLYAATWVDWMSHSAARLPGLFQESLFTGLFFSCYGLVDFTFGLFFAAVAWRCTRRQRVRAW